VGSSALPAVVGPPAPSKAARVKAAVLERGVRKRMGGRSHAARAPCCRHRSRSAARA
jgi:hypothetical protein